VKDFIPLGIGLQTSGPDPSKHQLLKIGFVSYFTGARFQIEIRQSEFNIDLNHCQDFLGDFVNGRGRDADLADEEIDRFLVEQSKVLFEDRPAARIMKMVPMGIHIDYNKGFIEKTLPKTFLHLWEDSIELTSLFVLGGLRNNTELTHSQGQYKTRAELKLNSTEMQDSVLLEAYSNCYILADFQEESPSWMHG